MLYIPTKCCEIILNGIKVIERTRFVCDSFPFGFEGGIWELCISVLDYCLSFSFPLSMGRLQSKNEVILKWTLHMQYSYFQANIDR